MSVKINFENGSKHYLLEHWFVGEGVAVSSGQDLAMIRADNKLNVVTAPINGIFLAKRVSEGESFQPGSTIGLIVSHEEAGDIKVTDKLTAHDRRILDSMHSKTSSVSSIAKPRHIKATPSSRREARQRGIDLREVTGTGPDGRIHLQDVIDHSSKGEQKEEKKEEDFVYNLPLSPIALQLVKEYGLDASKIPAPAGARRVRKKDVERYLEETQKEETLKKSPDLHEMLRQPEEQVLEETVETEPVVFDYETEESAQIKEQTQKEKDHSKVLQLEEAQQPRLIEEGEYEPTVIRLSTVVPAEQSSSQVIELGETANEEEREVQKDLEMTAKDNAKTPKDLSVSTNEQSPSQAHLTNFAIVDLAKIGIEKRKSEQSILDYAKDILLKTIVRALEAEEVNSLLYLPDIENEKFYSVKIKDNDLLKEASSLGDNDFIIVDLLSKNVASVSGLIDSDSRGVLYFSYTCQVSDIISGSPMAKSVISLNLDFDKNTIKPSRALKLLEEVKEALGSIDEVRR